MSVPRPLAAVVVVSLMLAAVVLDSQVLPNKGASFIPFASARAVLLDPLPFDPFLSSLDPVTSSSAVASISAGGYHGVAACSALSCPLQVFVVVRFARHPLALKTPFIYPPVPVASLSLGCRRLPPLPTSSSTLSLLSEAPPPWLQASVDGSLGMPTPLVARAGELVNDDDDALLPGSAASTCVRVSRAIWGLNVIRSSFEDLSVVLLLLQHIHMQ
uniref:Secreted protein n=1 Tax=Setaria italica TaxID=4555 RepID=K3ZWV5_SETIT